MPLFAGLVIFGPDRNAYTITFLCALGLFRMATGLLVADFTKDPIAIPIFAIVGFLLLVGSIYGWSFEPA